MVGKVIENGMVQILEPRELELSRPKLMDPLRRRGHSFLHLSRLLSSNGVLEPKYSSSHINSLDPLESRQQLFCRIQEVPSAPIVWLDIWRELLVEGSLDYTSAIVSLYTCNNRTLVDWGLLGRSLGLVEERCV